MNGFWITIIITVAAVGFFVVALSLTLLFKGHNIRSEIGRNKHLRSRGLRCTVEEFIDQERELWGEQSGVTPPKECSSSECSGCSQQRD